MFDWDAEEQILKIICELIEMVVKILSISIFTILNYKEIIYYSFNKKVQHK